jgi:hypothetical protein
MTVNIFKVGDKVQRTSSGSYIFPGVVIGVSPKLNGTTILYTVECIAPGVTGMAHEFTGAHLEYMTPQTEHAVESARKAFEEVYDVKDSV